MIMETNHAWISVTWFGFSVSCVNWIVGYVSKAIMKTNRLKKAKKYLEFYMNNYKFRQPYQTLIDGTFAVAALENKFNIKDQLCKYFQGETKLLTTPCIISESEYLASLESKLNGVTQILKQYAIHQCTHKKPIQGSECLKWMVGKNNESRYIIATQDRQLQDILRKIPGLPLIYLHGKTPTLEAPSSISNQFAEKSQNDLGMSSWETDNVKKLKEKEGLIEEIKLKKKRKKKGPNPLSCLKKKKKPQVKTTVKNNVGTIKKQKKIKIPAHVKEALINECKNKS